MSPLKVFNTLTNQKEDFVPLKGECYGGGSVPPGSISRKVLWISAGGGADVFEIMVRHGQKMTKSE